MAPPAAAAGFVFLYNTVCFSHSYVKEVSGQLLKPQCLHIKCFAIAVSFNETTMTAISEHTLWTAPLLLYIIYPQINTRRNRGIPGWYKQFRGLRSQKVGLRLRRALA